MGSFWGELRSKLAVVSFGAGVFLTACGTNTTEKNAVVTATSEKDVIYGDDNRLDYYQVQNPQHQKLADSTVALFDADVVTDDVANPTHFALPATKLGEDAGLCHTEAFFDQPDGAYCSGSLIAADLVLTAGHCVRDSVACSSARFVFGYQVKLAGIYPTSVPKTDVYNCKEIVHSEVADDGVDFAVVRLDRAVSDHTPLKLRQTNPVKVGDALMVIGHPSGLPTKLAAGANVRSLKTGFFMANLDTYGGNSGSGVFDPATGEILGLLVRGENDYKYTGECRISYVCPSDGCRGEDVTNIADVIRILPSLVGGPDPVVPPVNPPENPVTPPKPTVTFAGLGVRIYDFVAQRSVIVAKEAPEGRAVQVKINLSHPRPADLVLELQAPDGKLFLLQNRSPGGGPNIVGTFGVDLKSVDSLSPLATLSQKGKWQLIISDHRFGKVGRLNSWELIFKGAER